MPGPRMMLFMILPVLLSVVLVFMVRPARPSSTARRARATWLVGAALASHVAVIVIRSTDSLPAQTVNRVGACVELGLLATFIWLNSRAAPQTVAGVWLLAGGAGLNSLAILIFGWMPVLGSAAATAGYHGLGTVGHPNNGYILSDHMSLLARYIGDFMPIRGQLKVLSIGDVALVAGLVVVLTQALLSVRSSPELDRRQRTLARI